MDEDFPLDPKPTPEFQGVTFWLGDGLPVTLHDTLTKGDLLDLIDKPLQRAVLITRLRIVTKWLEES
jgi:hypothetical protein